MFKMSWCCIKVYINQLGSKIKSQQKVNKPKKTNLMRRIYNEFDSDSTNMNEMQALQGRKERENISFTSSKCKIGKSRISI